MSPSIRTSRPGSPTYQPLTSRPQVRWPTSPGSMSPRPAPRCSSPPEVWADSAPSTDTKAKQCPGSQTEDFMPDIFRTIEKLLKTRYKIGFCNFTVLLDVHTLTQSESNFSGFFLKKIEVDYRRDEFLSLVSSKFCETIQIPWISLTICLPL